MNEKYEAEIAWFLKHRGETERVRPATVKEQVWMFELTGGAVHDSVRVVRDAWYWTAGREAAILRLSPA